MSEGEKRPERVPDILAEMRDERIIHIEDADATRCLLRNLADRIEAAVKDELAVAHAVAGDFRATLAKALDTVCYLQAMLRDKARGGKAAPAKFDEAAFDAAVSKPNGWSGVADPVAEIRRMRDGVAQETPKLEQCGNAAALRAALRESTAILAVVHGEEYSGEIGMQIDKNTEALAAPARNCDLIAPTCDLKTAIGKFAAFCNRFRHCEGCPVKEGKGGVNCSFAWLLAPAEGGAE